MYKDKVKQAIFLQGYYAGYRKATIDHLGGKCCICGSKSKLTIHHKKPLNRRSRQYSDLKNLSELELRCENCHVDLVKPFKKKRKRF